MTEKEIIDSLELGTFEDLKDKLEKFVSTEVQYYSLVEIEGEKKYVRVEIVNDKVYFAGFIYNEDVFNTKFKKVNVDSSTNN